MHPPKVYFPVVVDEALLVEPTETQTCEPLDAFVAVIAAIVDEAAEDPELARNAPYTTPVRRLDETGAASVRASLQRGGRCSAAVGPVRFRSATGSDEGGSGARAWRPGSGRRARANCGTGGAGWGVWNPPRPPRLIRRTPLPLLGIRTLDLASACSSDLRAVSPTPVVARRGRW